MCSLFALLSSLSIMKNTMERKAVLSWLNPRPEKRNFHVNSETRLGHEVKTAFRLIKVHSFVDDICAQRSAAGQPSDYQGESHKHIITTAAGSSLPIAFQSDKQNALKFHLKPKLHRKLFLIRFINGRREREGKAHARGCCAIQVSALGP
jgi:hypothetical protein